MRVGLIGLGTVGAALARQLVGNTTFLQHQAGGNPLTLAAVSARSQKSRPGLDLTGVLFVADPLAIARDPQIDLVVELVGGHDGIAKQVVEAALHAGKSVVTANKALLAHHGSELLALASQQGKILAFEAAVAGAIPVIKVLHEGLAANQLHRVVGILNGTCNYLLTQMQAGAGSFDSVLAAAQQAGYAEANPSTDIDGHDSAHKLAILSALAFGHPIILSAVAISGIRAVTAQDITYAAELGYHIKLLAIAERGDDGLVRQRVQPCLLPRQHPLAGVDNVTNAVQLKANLAGQSLLEGPGAGGDATASAVLADLVDIAVGRRQPISVASTHPSAVVADNPLEKLAGRCYWRLQVVDQPGVLAAVAAVLARHQISIESLLQRPSQANDLPDNLSDNRPDTQAFPDGNVPVVLVTHRALEPALQAAADELAKLPQLHQPPLRLRIEDNLA
ncbi:MAG: homoserine dehydrogenase [Holosporaceae bacterium]